VKRPYNWCVAVDSRGYIQLEQEKLLKARFILKGAVDGIYSKMGKVVEPL